MTTVRENLIAARALIDTPEKWGKGKYEPSPGCYCVYGALDAIGGGIHRANSDAIEALRSALPRNAQGTRQQFDIVSFNDDPSTTHADIMALFDRAIASLPLNAEGGDK